MQAYAATLSSAAAPGTPLPLAIGIAAPLLALLISTSVVWLLRRNRLALLHILDQPNERSLHGTPVPRTGGVGVLLGAGGGLALALPWLLTPAAGWSVVSLVLATVLLAGVSLLDDCRHVPARYRLAAQLLAAALALAAGVVWRALGLPGLGGLQLPGWLAPALTLVLIVWIINLYNFMDGMDGLAGGMAVFGFGGLAVLGTLAGALDYALVAAVIAATAGGFLLHNLPRAEIFLGDVGSTVLGFWAAVLLLWGAGRGLFPLWVGLLVFSPFLVDATWTLLRRLARGAPVWQAHREHHYQRLVLAGWSTRRTLLWAYVLMGAAAASAVGARGLTAPEQWLLLAGWAGLYALVHLRVALVERGQSAAPDRS